MIVSSALWRERGDLRYDEWTTGVQGLGVGPLAFRRRGDGAGYDLEKTRWG